MCHIIFGGIFRGSAVKIMFEVIDNPPFVRAFGLTSCLKFWDRYIWYQSVVQARLAQIGVACGTDYVIMYNLYECLGKLDKGYGRDSEILGYLTLKCMAFNCSLTFEFGYPHTLVQMDPAKGCGPFCTEFQWYGTLERREQSKYHTSRG